jgi:hypothetical protein
VVATIYAYQNFDKAYTYFDAFPKMGNSSSLQLYPELKILQILEDFFVRPPIHLFWIGCENNPEKKKAKPEVFSG